MLIFVFIFGLIIGSFLNCFIWRLRQGEGILNRSYCPKCGKQIVWYDNIPVLSFIFLRGRCRHCGKSISWQYPIIELITAILFSISFIIDLQLSASNIFPDFQFSIFNFQTIFNVQYLTSNIFLILNFKFLILLFRDWFLIAVMIIIFVYDLRWYLILDVVTLPACIIVFILNLVLGFGWRSMLISGIIGASFFLIQFIISQGRWIGGGDIRLGLLIGLALGWPKVILAIFLAYFIGSIIAVCLILLGKKKWGSKIPLGIFLSASVVITMFYGEMIMKWYFHLFSYGL